MSRVPVEAPEGAPDFQELQFAFTRHMRDPGAHAAPPGIEDRRLGVYRELLYNNIERFIANNFPVLKEITPEESWHAMVRDYFARHIARTPLFPKIPQEFLHYLESEREEPGDPPFLLELAHYEWVEAALLIDTREIDFDAVDPNGDLLEGVPVLSPLAWPLAYRFPVHRIRPDFLPQEAPGQMSYLVVYRDRHDRIGFMELNPVSARLVELIGTAEGRNGRALLQQIAEELQHPRPAMVVEGGRDVLDQLHARDVVVGVAK